MKLARAACRSKASPFCLLLLVVLTAPFRVHAQSAADLLSETARNYQTLTAFELDGHANLAIPGSAWQFNFAFSYIGPRKKPSSDGGPPTIRPGAGRVDGGKPVKTVLESTEQPPSGVGFPFSLLQNFGMKIADQVLTAERSGAESLQLNGEDVACDILKVTYAPSTSEHPHPESVSYWIDPARHFILKEILTFRAGRIENGLWTVSFDSVKFNRPPPQWLLDMANIPEVRERSEWIGKPAPEFALPASDGSTVTLSSLRGKEVLLDFWSIYCGPCKLEMPMIEEVGHEYEDRGVVVLGISLDPADESKSWLARNGRTLRTVTDSEFTASEAYSVPGIPALVMVGRDGKVEHYWEGTVEKAALQAALNSSLKK